MFQAGKILRQLFVEVKERIIPGANLSDVDDFVKSYINDYKAKSALRMLGFPGYMSYSIDNEVIQHEANNRIVKEDQLMSIDMTMYYEGFFVDKAESFVIPPAHYVKRYLVTAVNNCLQSGISVVRAGVVTSFIGSVIEAQANYMRVKVSREFYGHGIGENHHQKPLIPNFNNGSDEKVRNDTFIAVEPIVYYDYNRTWHKDLKVFSDKLCAHAEDTVYVKKDGAEVVT